MMQDMTGTTSSELQLIEADAETLSYYVRIQMEDKVSNSEFLRGFIFTKSN